LEQNLEVQQEDGEMEELQQQVEVHCMEQVVVVLEERQQVQQLEQQYLFHILHYLK